MGRHLKRLDAPKSWKIERKRACWTIKPSPGPHPLKQAVPLGMVLRDYLKLCDSSPEARIILGKGDILVDGRKRKNYKYPCGFMDVISIPKLGDHYRLLFDQRGKICLVSIPPANASWKLVRIEDKRVIRRGRTQLNLYEGRNLMVEEDYNTNDTLKISLLEQKVLDCFKLVKGNWAMVIGGKHLGKLATVTKVKRIDSPQSNKVWLKAKESFSTIQPYVFVVGKEKPEITLPAPKI
jgi:small subunit ribosomal protein S4e